MQENAAKMKYLLYARKSSETADRQVASIESQIQELTKVARKLKLAIVDTLSESKSAKAPGRAVFAKMMERIGKGEANAILCWKLDRLARNPIDGGAISWMLQTGGIQEIQTYERAYHPTDNVLIMQVEFGMANQFIRDLSITTKRGLKTKAERGWYPSGQTLGYMPNPLKRKGEKEIIEDPERFTPTRKMFEMMLSGRYTVSQIYRIVHDEWRLKTRLGKDVARSTLYRIFKDKFYYGPYEYPKGSGHWYDGKHKKMVTEEEYNRIQVILGRRGKPRPQKHFFAYTGLIRCGECGAMITAENHEKYQKNGNYHHYTHYHCTKRKGPCSQKTIRVENLEKQLDEILEKICIPKEFIAWAMEILRSENSKESAERNAMMANFKRGYSVALKKLDTLIDMRAAGEITEDEYAASKTKAIEEKEKFNKLLNDTNARVDDWIERAEEIFDFASMAKEKFENGTPEEKRDVISTLGSNLYLRDRKLSVSLASPLVLAEKATSELRAISERLEPQKALVNNGRIEEIYSEYQPLLPG